MSSAAETYWLESQQEEDEEEEEEDETTLSLDAGRMRNAARRRVQRIKARVGNNLETPKFRKGRQQQTELTRKGNLSVPLRDQRPLSLVRSHDGEVKDAQLGDPVCWRAELDGRSLDPSTGGINKRGLDMSTSSISGGAVEPEDSGFVSVSLDPEDTIDPEILELIGETVEDPEGPEVLGVSAHCTYGKAPTANRVRRMLMQPADVEFDPTDHEHYTLDREPGCIALQGGYLT